MRDAKRAHGERSTHRPRLEGATSRRVRPPAARRSRGAVALFKRVFSETPPSGAAAWGYFCSAFHAGTWGRRHSCLRSRDGRASGDEHPPRGVPAIAHLQRALFLSVHVGLKPYAKQFRPVGALIFHLPAGTLRGRKPNPLKSPKSLFVFSRLTPKTRTSSPPKAAQKTLPQVFPRERLSLSSKL